MMPRFLDLVDIDFFLVALRYTLMEQETLEIELPRCAERGVGIVIGGVFNSGILATGAIPGRQVQLRRRDPGGDGQGPRIEAVCRRHDVPLAAAALQFPLGHPFVASVIPGAISPRPRRAERRPVPPRDPGRPVGRTEARGTAASGRADAVAI